MSKRFPKLLKPIIDIAVPWNVLEEAPDEREKVRKISYICRGAAIFQVSVLYVYTFGKYDPKELRFLVRNLEYLITPPYLRKQLFKLEPELKLAGLLAPLRTPSHYATSTRPKPGDYAEGVVIRWDGYYSIVKIGENLYAKVPRPYPIGTVLTLRIEAETGREDTFRAHVVDKDKLGIYWNIRTEVKELRELVRSQDYSLIILTGKEGKDLRTVYKELIARLRSAREDGKKILVLFGSPRMGVDQILSQEGIEIEEPRMMFINFIPEQGVDTVRTEEAIIAVLSTLHFMRTCLT